MYNYCMYNITSYMKQIIQYLYNVHFFYVLISDEIVQFHEQERVLIRFNSVDERRCRNEHGCQSHEPGRDAGTKTILLLYSTFILVILLKACTGTAFGLEKRYRNCTLNRSGTISSLVFIDFKLIITTVLLFTFIPCRYL